MKFSTILVLATSYIACASVNAYAQSRKEGVCWGELPTACSGGYLPNDFPGIVTVFFACKSGGHRGFDPDYVCSQLCNSPQGPHCGIYSQSNWGYSAGECGYRYALVSCHPVGMDWSPGVETSRVK
jgi:hypothetical protein